MDSNRKSMPIIRYHQRSAISLLSKLLYRVEAAIFSWYGRIAQPDVFGTTQTRWMWKHRNSVSIEFDAQSIVYVYSYAAISNFYRKYGQPGLTEPAIQQTKWDSNACNYTEI